MIMAITGGGVPACSPETRRHAARTSRRANGSMTFTIEYTRRKLELTSPFVMKKLLFLNANFKKLVSQTYGSTYPLLKFSENGEPLSPPPSERHDQSYPKLNDTIVQIVLTNIVKPFYQSHKLELAEIRPWDLYNRRSVAYDSPLHYTTVVPMYTKYMGTTVV
ncbi:hypothetical protein EVAR_28218_1 [Eumeta japonica]|uniref:Uncharacterized protein n=1 Tax=Eumeta variegata TaxID=151549 RepID=A0A4C1VIK6_EUMVA|nr:hypothetical protein EVAR_28218_1 [Eumeta japonica]